MIAFPYRPLLTIAAVLLVIAAAMGMIGCSSTQAASTGESTATCSDCACGSAVSDAAKFEQDRQAILGMAGEYKVDFSFHETVAVRDGYELKEPYHSRATEMVVVLEDTGKFISMQHLLVVWMEEDKPHVVKHWRQDWQYEATAGYDFQGENVWKPQTFSSEQAKGAWVQSVYQVDDSPRYWGVGEWVHRDGVSTWTSSLTNRPLPRREFSKRSDYQILAAINSHVVTDDGWVHYQNNYKLDTQNPDQPVIALESGVNTYTKTDEVDFTAAKEYWKNTHAYWAIVRDAWSEVYGSRETVALKKTWRGDPMHSHIFDLADEFWGVENPTAARAKIQAVIGEFMEPEAVALP